MKYEEKRIKMGGNIKTGERQPAIQPYEWDIDISATTRSTKMNPIRTKNIKLKTEAHGRTEFELQSRSEKYEQYNNVGH